MKRLLGASLLVLTTACRGADDSGTTTARAPLATVSLPDMSNAADAVQQQIRERFVSLQTVLSRTDASPAERASAFGELGKLLVAAEYYNVAETCFGNASALAPDDTRWPYFLAHVYRFENQPEKASVSFERTLALAPDHVPALLWLADIRLAQNRPDAAEPLLSKAQALDSTSGAVLFRLGQLALAKQDFAAAVKYLEAALSAAPRATRVHYPLALAYRGLGNPGKAEEHLRLRGEVDLPLADPLLAELGSLLQNAAAYETRASRAMEARQWADAETNLRKAIERAPDNAQTRLNLATALFMQNDQHGALDQYRAALRLSPTLAPAHFGIGVIMESRGLDADAIAAFQAAVDRDPRYAEAQFSLANALRRVGRVKESLPHYEAVLRINPAVSQASFGYAIGLVRLGRYQEARARLEEAVKTFPDQLGFSHALARILAAAPDDRVRDGAQAVAIMSGLLKTQRSLATVETMAMALAELGRFDEAVKWQRDAIAGARENKRDDLAQTLAINLRLYENAQPCRTPWTDDDPVHHPVSAP